MLACELRVASGASSCRVPSHTWFSAGQGRAELCRRRQEAWQRSCAPGHVELRLARLCRAGEVNGAEAGEWSTEGANGLRYEPARCRLARPSADAARRRCLAGKHVLFLGDSLSRYIYLSLAYFLVRGEWPTDVAMSRATCGAAATCGSTPCFEGGVRPGVDEATRWGQYFNQTSALFLGHELCDCYRAGACCPEDAHTENRFTRFGDAALSYIAQAVSPRWRPHGHVLPGPFRSMRSGLACHPSGCGGAAVWASDPRDFVASSLRPLGVTTAIINTGHHWAPDAVDTQWWRELFEGAANSTRRSFWRTTTTSRGRIAGLSGLRSLRFSAIEAEAQRAGLGLLDLLSVTERLRTLPGGGRHAFVDDVHFVCDVYRELGTLLLNVLCDPAELSS
eukprot:3452771-Prymnesium_polylepis.1